MRGIQIQISSPKFPDWSAYCRCMTSLNEKWLHVLLQTYFVCSLLPILVLSEAAKNVHRCIINMIASTNASILQLRCFLTKTQIVFIVNLRVTFGILNHQSKRYPTRHILNMFVFVTHRMAKGWSTEISPHMILSTVRSYLSYVRINKQTDKTRAPSKQIKHFEFCFYVWPAMRGHAGRLNNFTRCSFACMRMYRSQWSEKMWLW